VKDARTGRIANQNSKIVRSQQGMKPFDGSMDPVSPEKRQMKPQARLYVQTLAGNAART
jgi:hypothetical protein